MFRAHKNARQQAGCGLTILPQRRSVAVRAVMQCPFTTMQPLLLSLTVETSGSRDATVWCLSTSRSLSRQCHSRTPCEWSTPALHLRIIRSSEVSAATYCDTLSLQFPSSSLGQSEQSISHARPSTCASPAFSWLGPYISYSPGFDVLAHPHAAGHQRFRSDQACPQRASRLCTLTPKL